MHIPLSVDIDFITLSYVHGEPVLPNRFEEPTRVFKNVLLLHKHQYLLLIPIFRIQIRENISTLPFSDTTTDSDSVSNDLPIALLKGKCTCTFHLISHFVSYSCLYFFFELIFCF